MPNCSPTHYIMQRINRASSAIKELFVYPYQGRASVMFNDGHMYDYENVSRRAIMNVLMNTKVSLGKWVNENLVNKDGVTFEWAGFALQEKLDQAEPELPRLA